MMPLRLRFLQYSFDSRIEDCCKTWQGTPYKEGARLKGVAVDCVNFVCGVIDELMGTNSHSLVVKIRGDTSLHNKAGVTAAMRAMLSAFPWNKEITDGTISPGDLLVTGPQYGGPGHVQLCGGYAGKLWHATVCNGVCSSGFDLQDGQRLFHIFRVLQWQ